MLREPAMWMSSRRTHEYSCDSFSPMLKQPFTKERLPAIRGTAHSRHTDLGCAPLLGTRPRDLCLKHRTFRSFSLPLLVLVESFPGAMSPLGSKEPNELFV